MFQSDTAGKRDTLGQAQRVTTTQSERRHEITIERESSWMTVHRGSGDCRATRLFGRNARLR